MSYLSIEAQAGTIARQAEQSAQLTSYFKTITEDFRKRGEEQEPIVKTERNVLLEQGKHNHGVSRRNLLRSAVGIGAGLALAAVPGFVKAADGHNWAWINESIHPVWSTPDWTPLSQIIADRIGIMTMQQAGSGPDLHDRVYYNLTGKKSYGKEYYAQMAAAKLNVPDDPTVAEWSGFCWALAIAGKVEHYPLEWGQAFVSLPQKVQLLEAKHAMDYTIYRIQDPPVISQELNYWVYGQTRDQRQALPANLPYINGIRQPGIWYRDIIGVRDDLNVVALRNWNGGIAYELSNGIERLQFPVSGEQPAPSSAIDVEDTKSWTNPEIRIELVNYLVLGSKLPPNFA